MKFSIKNVLVVYYVHNYKTLQLVEKCLKANKISYLASRRVHLTTQMCKNRDLVISVGGDGTFLRASHHIGATPVLSVSSDVRYNEAFYSRATQKDFTKKFMRLLKGKFKITKLPRLQAKLNGKRLPYLALNEVFVGSKHPYHTSRYWITIRGKKEFHKNSGILITTRSGSSGWAKSASRKPLKISKTGFGYVVREPYIGRLTKSKLLGGALSQKDVVKITSSLHAGIIVIYDENYKFELGKASMLKEGKDAAIISSGVLVHESLKAAEKLKEGGMEVAVINMSSIKPIDADAVKKAAETGVIIAAQDHNVYGGLGSAVAEVLAENKLAINFEIVGIKDDFAESDSLEVLFKKYGLDAEAIANTVKKAVSKK